MNVSSSQENLAKNLIVVDHAVAMYGTSSVRPNVKFEVANRRLELVIAGLPPDAAVDLARGLLRVVPWVVGPKGLSAEEDERQNEIAHLKKLLEQHKKTLWKLESDAARHGTDVPVKLDSDLECARENVRETEERLRALTGNV